MSIKSHLVNRAAKIEYPHKVTEENIYQIHSLPSKGRVDLQQIQFGPSRCGLILRHFREGHLLGYIMIKQELAVTCRPLLEGIEPVSYDGFGNLHISWRRMNNGGRCVTPTQLAPESEEADYFIGFSRWEGGLMRYTDEQKSVKGVYKVLEKWDYALREVDEMYSGDARWMS